MRKVLKIIIYILVIPIGVILAHYLNIFCFWFLNKITISNSARLIVLVLPFAIYGVVLFIVVPVVYLLLNVTFNKIKK